MVRHGHSDAPKGRMVIDMRRKGACQFQFGAMNDTNLDLVGLSVHPVADGVGGYYVTIWPLRDLLRGRHGYYQPSRAIRAY